MMAVARVLAVLALEGLRVLALDVGGHKLGLAVPAAWKEKAQTNDDQWVGIYQNGDGFVLFVTALPRAPSGPLDLAATTKTLIERLPQQFPQMAPVGEPTTEPYGGFVTHGRRLEGKKGGAPWLGTVVSVDAGPVGVLVVAAGPDAAYRRAWPLALSGLKQLTVDGARGPWKYAAPPTPTPPTPTPPAPTPPPKK